MVAAAAATSALSLCGGSALADSGAIGTASDSPGVLSGNNVQAPVEVPVNVCGNSVDVLAALNPPFGNSCDDGSGSVEDDVQDSPYDDLAPTTTLNPGPPHAPQTGGGQKPLVLADTGSNAVLGAAAASAALIASGAILYRRGRTAPRR